MIAIQAITVVVLAVAGLSALMAAWQAIQAIREIIHLRRAAKTAVARCAIATIQGPLPGGHATIMTATGVPMDVFVHPIPVGCYAMINVLTGEVTYSFPTDTNRNMAVNFSLDELDEAREFINNGGKLN